MSVIQSSREYLLLVFLSTSVLGLGYMPLTFSWKNRLLNISSEVKSSLLGMEMATTGYLPYCPSLTTLAMKNLKAFSSSMILFSLAQAYSPESTFSIVIYNYSQSNWLECLIFIMPLSFKGYNREWIRSIFSLLNPLNYKASTYWMSNILPVSQTYRHSFLTCSGKLFLYLNRDVYITLDNPSFFNCSSA